MLIARSPLRVTLGGGGTDLPSYYKKKEGFLISAAIDKYVYVTITRPFKEGIYLKYSKIEKVKKVSEVLHPIIREVLKEQNFKIPQIEITTLTDTPSGTGLGSSGSFTTALIKGLYSYQNKKIGAENLAQKACDIELNKLKEPIGKQDQYIASMGGITAFDFNKDDTVSITPLSLDPETIFELEDNLLLFFTGFSRSAGSILKDQKDRSVNNDQEMLDNLHYVKELGYRSKEALVSGDTNLFGQIMHEHWEHKKERSGGMSNNRIDSWYNLAMQNGAIGGKLVGAGGGGFLMFMAKDREKLRSTMKSEGLEEVRFSFDFEGTKVLTSS